MNDWIVGALVLVSQGAIQNLSPYADVTTLEAIVDGCLDQFSDEEIALWTEVARSVSRRRGAILPALNVVADPLTRARTAFYLVATSSQFQVER